MPAVSVIVPNYNHARHLKARIDSILNQTFQDFEVLIFDDASTDNSSEIIESYRHEPKISLIEIAKENSGSPFGAWEKGISLSSGTYIWIAESDDLADPSFLATHIDSFASNKSLLVSFSSSQWIDDKGQNLEVPTHELELYNEPSAVCLNEELTKGTFIYNMSSAVIKKELFTTVDFQKLKTYKYVGDWYFWSEALKQNGKVQRLTEPLNFFRRHGNNVSGKADKEGLQFFEGLPILMSILNTQSVPFFKKQRIFAFWAKKLYLSETQNKKECLKLLPFWGRLWYSIIPFIVKRN